LEFGINELIWAAINFVVFLVLLRLFLYRPVLKVIDARKDEIRENLSGAEAARREAEARQAEYERKVAEAREEAQKLIARAQTTADKTKEEILSQANRQAEELIERAKRAIGTEKEMALHEVRREIADLAVMAASKVIEKTLDAKEHRRLVDDFLKKLPDGEASETGSAG